MLVIASRGSQLALWQARWVSAQLAALGHWGVPTLVYAGQAYWGQDRIEDLERALRRAA